MSSNGELYIGEDCQEEFKEQLTEWYGEEVKLDYHDYIDYWNMSQLPKTMTIKILKDDGEKDIEVGIVEIENEFTIEEDSFGYRGIECNPKSIRRIK